MAQAHKWIALSTSENQGLREQAAEFLDGQGERAFDLLLEASRADDPAVRRGAVFALLGRAEPGNEPAMRAMLRALADRDPSVRRVAMPAAGNFTGPLAADAVKPLAAMLVDSAEPASVRGQVARILGRLDAPPEPVIEALRAALDAEKEVAVRKALLLAIVNRSSDVAVRVDVLRKRIRDDADSGLRQIALQHLARLGPDGADAVPDVLPLLGDADEALRKEAALALAAMGERAVSGLVDELSAGEPRRVLGAIAVLARIGPPARAARDGLKKLSNSPNATIRRQSAEALKRIDNAR